MDAWLVFINEIVLNMYMIIVNYILSGLLLYRLSAEKFVISKNILIIFKLIRFDMPNIKLYFFRRIES